MKSVLIGLIFVLLSINNPLAQGAEPTTLIRKLLPTKAISYTPIVSKERFDELFPGKSFEADQFPEEPGTYIVYQHGRITYFFGPETDRNIAQRYLEYLNNVVDQVQDKREHLKTAKTYLLDLPQEKNAENSKAETLPDEPEEHSEKASSNTTEPWWKRLFPWWA